jgi:hypothetical protein
VTGNSQQAAFKSDENAMMNNEKLKVMWPFMLLMIIMIMIIRTLVLRRAKK